MLLDVFLAAEGWLPHSMSGIAIPRGLPVLSAVYLYTVATAPRRRPDKGTTIGVPSLSLSTVASSPKISSRRS